MRLQDYEKNFIENVTTNKRYKERDEDESGFVDELGDFLAYESKDKRMSKEKLEVKQKARALSGMIYFFTL